MEAALKRFLEEAQNKGGTLQKYWRDARMCVATPNSALPVRAKLNSADKDLRHANYGSCAQEISRRGSKQRRNTTELLAGYADVCRYAEPGVASGSGVDLGRKKI